ncbi:MAG: MFS transporter [Patescibacteria group bacterium]|nr:MFS transporter [Patescibacteria group bacterium]
MKFKNLSGVPKNVLFLSFVSLLNDVAGETIRRLIPLFLANILGVKTTIIGLIEGIGEATPNFIEPVSGYLSDKFGKRKVFVVIGQILRSSMILLMVANSWLQVLLIRFLDRTGKGLAMSPRDALLAKSSKDGEKGRAFGLNRAMDNTGATIGVGLVILLLLLSPKRLILDRTIFNNLITIVAVPALFLALLIIFLLVREVKDGLKEYQFKDHLGREFYIFLLISFIFSLGNFSDGFLVLKAQNIGISLLGIFILLAFFEFFSAIVALPAGSYSDHHERRKILGFGWLIFSAAYLGFGSAQNLWQMIPLFMIYGVYYGITQGVAKAIIADFVPHSRQGLAFGLYNMTVGVALLPASVIAGFLWQTFSPVVAFYFGAVLSLLAAFSLFHILPHPHHHWWEIWKK